MKPQQRDAKPPLPQQMKRLADTGHPRADELRERAVAFETATKAFWGQPENLSTEESEPLLKNFLGTWARARRCYEECSAPAGPDSW